MYPLLGGTDFGSFNWNDIFFIDTVLDLTEVYKEFL